MNFDKLARLEKERAKMKTEKIVKITSSEGDILRISDFDSENVKIEVTHRVTATPFFQESHVIVPKSMVYALSAILEKYFI